MTLSDISLIILIMHKKDNAICSQIPNLQSKLSLKSFEDETQLKSQVTERTPSPSFNAESSSLLNSHDP